MQTELYEKIFGSIDGEDSYIFIPVDEAITMMAETYEIGLEELKRISADLELTYNLVAPKSGFISSNDDFEQPGNQNKSEGTLELASGVKFSFNTDTLELDGLEVLDSFEENDNTYITLGGFPISVQQDEQIREEARKIYQSTAAFKKIDKNVLEQILFKSSPADIARLCQTDQRFRATCNDPNVFRRLLDKHYPNAVYTANPRKQFIAIASGVKTFYRMKMKGEVGEKIIDGNDGVYKHHLEEVEQMGEPSRIEDIEGWSVDNMPSGYKREWNGGKQNVVILLQGLPEQYHDNLPHGDYLIFYVDGLPVPRGEKLYLLMDTGNEFGWDAKVYKRREDLATDWSKDYEGQLEELLEDFLYGTEVGDALDEMYPAEGYPKSSVEQLNLIRRVGFGPKFDEYLKEKRVQIPFTPEGMRERAMHDENLYLHPDTYHNQAEVIIPTF